MDTNYNKPIESFNTYNKNQTTLGEHALLKQLGPAPQQGRPQKDQVIWKGASSYGKYRNNINN